MKEYQIAQLIRVAKEQIEYCITIVNHPKNVGRKNFDVVSPIDKFYKTVCNMAFNDALLIIASLLNNKDKRVISLWNFKDFAQKKQNKLNEITNEFINTGLKKIRDQIIAHQDFGNKNNNIPNSRRRGIIDINIIILLQNILNNITFEFKDFATKYRTPYSGQYFDTSNAKQEIELVLKKAKPKLTDDTVI